VNWLDLFSSFFFLLLRCHYFFFGAFLIRQGSRSRIFAGFVLLMSLAGPALCDMYLQNMRGSNNRLDEANRDRDNANRFVSIHSFITNFQPVFLTYE